ncbi:hypothetical protein ZWY2020_025967 [Hordeum vulgare]|nr:hypothetical protein ZWY2020_025967 [Hordeum vulgare]
MESKAILVCLLLIVQLGNSIHVERCRQAIAFTGPTCTKIDCLYICKKLWGDDILNVVCRIVGIFSQTCYCIVCT